MKMAWLGAALLRYGLREKKCQMSIENGYNIWFSYRSGIVIS